MESVFTVESRCAAIKAYVQEISCPPSQVKQPVAGNRPLRSLSRLFKIPGERINAMTQKKLYLTLQSVLCILLVILLSASAISIYRDGRARKAENPMEWIYSRELVSKEFKPIAPLFFGAVGLTVAGWIFMVKDENAEKPVKDAELVRNLIVARVAQPSETMKAERGKQKKLFWKCSASMTHSIPSAI